MLVEPVIDQGCGGQGLGYKVLCEDFQNAHQRLRHLIICKEITARIEIFGGVLVFAVHSLHPPIHSRGALLHEPRGIRVTSQMGVHWSDQPEISDAGAPAQQIGVTLKVHIQCVEIVEVQGLHHSLALRRHPENHRCMAHAIHHGVGFCLALRHIAL